MTKRGLLVLLPCKTLRLASTWVSERKGSQVHLWANAADHRKGTKAAVHTHSFQDEPDASGALHLLTEAALYAEALGAGAIDLRSFCFWEEVQESEPPEEAPKHQGISLASLASGAAGK